MKKRERKKKKKNHKKSKKKNEKRHETSSSSEEDEDDIKRKKLLAAVQLEEQRLKKVDKLLTLDERKRPYNSMAESKAPDEEEMEAYYMKRKRDEDPMLAFF